MFTGLIQHVGHVRSADRDPAGLRLVVVRGGWTPAADPVRGDSVAVSGVCLTVEEATPETLTFRVIGQTLAVTKLGRLGPGDRVNLECAVTASQPLGGHFVQGHADGLGEVAAIQTDAGDWRVRVDVPGGFARHLVDRGSVAVDGVSLTLAEVHDGPAGFTVCLIPETLEMTTLGSLAVGDPVHLEADVLVKAVNARVEAMLGGQKQERPVTRGMLLDAGFASSAGSPSGAMSGAGRDRG
ncbi:riboflavin synthase [Phycisphaera mikurensis]|uniref:Riboflavin synthase n=1 Tax=Phycisphaera mikurensis (strain NBRC 102666 / KCTC 22515 / FYK2301M01) TaxID=1142394 RepID=I0IF23_PHYMF|nr:riboflavin synthase [Phycisphaera mikurensis]MBB6441652.1 riboflavin synthase [Phycisphaera mikurensis]BAM03861.1 riboflavin synthase alpha chain [Phycisphaera mikurensis NBRC 102666]